MAPTTYALERRQLAAMLPAALGFLVISGGLVVIGSGVDKVLAAVLAVPFYGLAVAVFLVRMARRGPELTVTDEGFVHRRFGQVSWSEVETVEATRYSSRYSAQDFVEVVLHDPEEYLARRPFVARMLARKNMRMGFSPVTLSCDLLPITTPDLLAVMRQRHQDFLASA